MHEYNTQVISELTMTCGTRALVDHACVTGLSDLTTSKCLPTPLNQNIPLKPPLICRMEHIFNYLYILVLLANHI